MSWRNERFADGMRSLDRMLEGVDASKVAALSDRYAGAARLVRDVDETPASVAREETRIDAERARRIDAARRRLVRAGGAHLVPVLLLIIRNGRRRGESIRELAQRGGLSREAAEHLYFGHRKKIENILLGQ